MSYNFGVSSKYFSFFFPQIQDFILEFVWLFEHHTRNPRSSLSYAVAKNILLRIFCCLISINQHDVVLGKKKKKKTVTLLHWTLHPVQYSKSAAGWCHPHSCRWDLGHFMTKPSILALCFLNTTVSKRTINHEDWLFISLGVVKLLLLQNWINQYM